MTELPPTSTPPLAARPLDDEPMTPGQILFSFDGRIPRRTWWLYGVLGMVLAGAFANALLRIVGIEADHAEAAVNLLLLWPILAISAKRWHDRGKSTWWVLVWMVPVIGWLWTLVENGFLPGDPGPNRYGQNLAGRL